MKRIEVLLDRSAEATNGGVEPSPVDENVLAAQLCATLAEPTVVVEQLLQDPSRKRLSQSRKG